MRGWSDEQADAVFTGGTGAGRADGVGASQRARFGLGGDRLDRIEDRLHGGDAAGLGSQAERDQGVRAGPTSEERKRIKALEREVRELRQANEILRKASAYLAMAEPRYD